MDFPEQVAFDVDSKRTYHYIHNHYPVFEQYLNNHYKFASKWSEKLYCYYNNINEPVHCSCCGNRVKFISFNKGYKKYCSDKCSNKDPNKKLKVRQTNLKKYGVEYYAQSKEGKMRICEIINTNVVKEKHIKTCRERYGTDNPTQSQHIKDKLHNIISSKEVQNKTKQTNLERYGVEYVTQSIIVKNKTKQTNLAKYGTEYYTQSKEGRNRLIELQNSDVIKDKIKQTNITKYGAEYYTQSDEFKSRANEIQGKINNTKYINNTFNVSSIEEKFASYLNNNNILYKRQYKSEVYPFNCDFYIPKYDLYIEIQGSWTHGGHPYNKEKDKEKLEYWKSKQTKFYNNAIETWTIRDVKKREAAQLNKLNYLEIFSCKLGVAINIFKQYIGSK